MEVTKSKKKPFKKKDKEDEDKALQLKIINSEMKEIKNDCISYVQQYETEAFEVNLWSEEEILSCLRQILLDYDTNGYLVDGAKWLAKVDKFGTVFCRLVSLGANPDFEAQQDHDPQDTPSSGQQTVAPTPKSSQLDKRTEGLNFNSKEKSTGGTSQSQQIPPPSGSRNKRKAISPPSDDFPAHEICDTLPTKAKKIQTGWERETCTIRESSKATNVSLNGTSKKPTVNATGFSVLEKDKGKGVTIGESTKSKSTFLASTSKNSKVGEEDSELKVLASTRSPPVRPTHLVEKTASNKTLQKSLSSGGKGKVQLVDTVSEKGKVKQSLNQDEEDLLRDLKIFLNEYRRDFWRSKMLTTFRLHCRPDELIDIETVDGEQRLDKQEWLIKAAGIVANLEELACEGYKQSRSYQFKLRALSYNLQDVPLLSKRLHEGILSPTDVFSFTPEELKEAHKISAESTPEISRKSTVEGPLQYVDILCGQCGEKRALVQNIFDTGKDSRYQLECEKCGYQWHARPDVLLAKASVVDT